MGRDDGSFLHGFAQLDRARDADAGSGFVFFKNFFNETAAGDDKHFKAAQFGLLHDGADIASSAFGAYEAEERVASGLAGGASQALRQQDDFSFGLFFEFLQVDGVLNLNQYFIDEQSID